MKVEDSTEDLKALKSTVAKERLSVQYVARTLNPVHAASTNTNFPTQLRFYGKSKGA